MGDGRPLFECNPELTILCPYYAAVPRFSFAVDSELKDLRNTEGASQYEPGAARREVDDGAWEFMPRWAKPDGPNFVQRGARLPSAVFHKREHLMPGPDRLPC
jgi:hypothetical protein